MTYINLPSDQQTSISEVDETVLRAAVRKCLDEARLGPIHSLGLSSCGPYVATKLNAFQQAIAEYSKAKAPTKRERTLQDALRAGSDLVHAVQQMKDRLEAEREDGELFFIDDQIRPPFSSQQAAIGTSVVPLASDAVCGLEARIPHLRLRFLP